jgi:hypothetical protein
MNQARNLPSELKRFAWLSLDSEAGQEYCAAMELMGLYATANHECIHRHIAANLVPAASCAEGEQHMENLDRVKELARDLRREEPRRSSEELAGEAHAARVLDKCRATLAGCTGEFTFGCAMDRHFFAETRIDMQEFQDFVAGANDEEVANWIRERMRSRGIHPA